MTARGTLAAIALCFLSAAAGFFAYRHLAPAARAVATATTSAEIPPDLQFHDLDGRARTLSEWRGQLVLLNFWATWCAPCIKEIPLLVDAQQRYGARGLQVVGIAMDETASVREFQARMHMGYPIMIGASEIVNAMDQLGNELGALPFSVLIGADGRIAARTAGGLERQDIESWVKDRLPR